VKDISNRAGGPKGSFYNHFEFLRDEVVEFGSARGCLRGNFGTEIIDHSGGPT
jgi:TetR/AcrR family transcriptional repressor of nem operon